jgi:chromosome segregation ATPase
MERSHEKSLLLRHERDICDHLAKEVRLPEELAVQLAAAHQKGTEEVANLRIKEMDAHRHVVEAKEKAKTLILRVCKDVAEDEWVWKEWDDLLQTIAGLRAECDSVRQERDVARGCVNDFLSKVEMERGLKLKAKDVSTELAMEVARCKAKLHTLEIEVSQQSEKIDKLWWNVDGEPLSPMSLLFLDPRCLLDMVGIMAWEGLEDKLAEEVVKSRDLGGSL